MGKTVSPAAIATILASLKRVEEMFDEDRVRFVIEDRENAISVLRDVRGAIALLEARQ